MKSGKNKYKAMTKTLGYLLFFVCGWNPDPQLYRDYKKPWKKDSYETTSTMELSLL